MCGIAGGINLGQNPLGRMIAALDHRGPDARDFSVCDGISLGSSRLAILDRAHGRPIFSSPDDSIHAICNGEIYNWRQLRDELGQLGHTFHTECDTEILPAAWREWGVDLPERLNGMFALAIHDRSAGSLFLARDRCGQKPIYLTDCDAGPMRFASEIGALAAAGVRLAADPRYLGDWLGLRYVPEPATLFQGIITLPAAHSLLLKADGSRQLERYWQPQVSSHGEVRGKCPEPDELDDLTRSAVELALESEAPIGTYLSGGVDSALLGHYLKQAGVSPPAFSIGFGAGSDESQTAAETATLFGFEHHDIRLTPAALDDLPRVVRQMGRPVGDALILAFDRLASEAASTGAKVVLGGEGPDEHFGGYSFHRVYLAARMLGAAGRAAVGAALTVTPPALLDAVSNFPAKLGSEGRLKVAHYLKDFGGLNRTLRYTSLHRLHNPLEADELLAPELLDEQLSFSLNNNEPESFTDLLASQYQSWLPDWSLIRQDRNTMAHSLEYRAPFLDHRLIDYSFSLPRRAKTTLRHDKILWRALAARHLPKAITQRPKQPFYLPLESPEWRRPFVDLAHDVLSPHGFSCGGLLNPDAVRTLLQGKTFLPLKKLAAVVILQLWLDQYHL
ncbi:MAG: asparagine synthase (glutamine-hydrolyzing) [Verrucomicrobiae bacterium]|nr:asparagine synthase (glutamine-hydrolyzing) [Verrucomicrobiae bacterium]NNJ43244.1 asparagine synthase (glutamine-hydrolyzing) [Akkermansiaceae bacterium]